MVESSEQQFMCRWYQVYVYVLEEAGRIYDRYKEGSLLSAACPRQDFWHEPNLVPLKRMYLGYGYPKTMFSFFLFIQNERTGEQRQLSEATGTSLTERLKHLERLIRSSREEEIASELHISALLDMVDIWAADSRAGGSIQKISLK